MANKMRWRHGDTNPVLGAVDSAQVIEIGDMIWLNTDDVRASGQVTYVGLALTQENLANQFLGVAMQTSASGDTDPIRVATSGVFEMDCASATHELGELMGAADNSGSTAIENQKVVSLGVHTHANFVRAIGRCAKRVASAATSVLVSIHSTVMLGEYQAGTASA